jgi:hypothetical protein
MVSATVAGRRARGRLLWCGAHRQMEGVSARSPHDLNATDAINRGAHCFELEAGVDTATGAIAHKVVSIRCSHKSWTLLEACSLPASSR